MKKIIVGILSFVFLFVGQNVFAATIWNTGSGGPECPDINIANYTTNTGYGSPCWTGTNINANPGDTINVKIYYHNTSNTTATNTVIKLVAPTGSSTNHSFTAQIVSPQGSLYSAPVTVTIPSSQTLSFGSTIWYTKPDPINQPNYLAPTPLLNGQNGADVISTNGGLYIGNIASGWTTQGAVVVSFKVSNTTTNSNCTLSSFSANPSTINPGQSSTLTWGMANCALVKLYDGPTLIGVYNSPQTQTSVSPVSTTNYNLQAYSYKGILSGSKNTTVTVNPIVQQMTGNISVTPPASTSCVIASGNSTCGISFTWTTQNPEAVSAVTHNGATVANGNNGTKTFAISKGPQTYFLYNNTVLLDQETVYASCAVNTSWNGSSCAPTIVTNNCIIDSFYGDPTSITSTQDSTLKWTSRGCSYFKLYEGTNLINTYYGNQQIVSPNVTTTYTLKAYNYNNILGDSESTTITVKGIIIPTDTCTIKGFTASPDFIKQGGYSTLVWSTSNCVSTSISPSIGPVVPVIGGSLKVKPIQTTTYTLTATGSNGVVKRQTVTVVVDSIIISGCKIKNFTANPDSIMISDYSVLKWETEGCTKVTISNLAYNIPTSGEQKVWPTQTTNYILSAEGENGLGMDAQVTIYVNSVPSTCKINDFAASDTSINLGDSSTLSWSTSNCAHVAISNIGNVDAVNSKVVWPVITKTYTLTVENQYGSVVDSRAVTIYVNDNNNNTCKINNFTASDTSIDDGDSSTLHWNTTNCERIKISDVGDYLSDDGSETVSPNEDTTYVLTAYDSNGTHDTASVRIYVDNNNNNDNDCSIDSYSASDTYISRGDDVTLRWRTTDCDDVSITNVGDVNDDGSETVSPYSTTTYVLRAYGNHGSDSESIKINVDYNNYETDNTNVVTTIATNISQNSAQVNGLITNTNYNSASTYFEYGTNVTLGMRTSSRNVSGSTNFSEYLTNLSPNTIYYFRAVGEGSNGVSRGAIEIFRTLGYTNYNNTNYNNTNTTTRTIREYVYQQGTTVSGSESPIVLRIENKYQNIGIGDIVDYVVFYKNISSSTLTHPMVQVFIPQGLTLLNSSRGTYQVDDRTLSVPIEDLYPDAEGVIYLQARVDSLEINLAQIVTTAVLVYTNPNGAQENAMAYVLNNPKIVNLLGASAFFGGMYGMSLIGWLILILIILLLIFIARSFYYRRNITTTTHTTSTHL
ncbi:MAG: hypothetical protein WCT42_00530 [Candidatus Paceibacterota bacterium]